MGLNYLFFYLCYNTVDAFHSHHHLPQNLYYSIWVTFKIHWLYTLNNRQFFLINALKKEEAAQSEAKYSGFTIQSHLPFDGAPIDFPAFHRDFPVNGLCMFKTVRIVPGRKGIQKKTGQFRMKAHNPNSTDRNFDPLS